MVELCYALAMPSSNPLQAKRKPRPRRAGTPSVHPFPLESSRSIRRGIRGKWVSVALEGTILAIANSEEQAIVIPIHTIERILVGREPGRAAYYHRLQIWMQGESSIVLHINDRAHDMARYATLVRTLAESLEQAGRIGAMRIGLPRLYAFGIPLLIIATFILVMLVGPEPEVLRDATVRDFVIGGLLIVAVTLACTVVLLRQGLQRRLRRVADLDRLFGPP